MQQVQVTMRNHYMIRLKVLYGKSISILILIKGSIILKKLELDSLIGRNYLQKALPPLNFGGKGFSV
jgi:hypothetical protein